MKLTPTVSIVSLEQFIQSTRDAGYRGVASALAELVDNSLEANASTVWIDVERSKNGEVSVVTTDDGCGMNPSILQIALQFGGSTRFNSRRKFGRFGMGLSNSSLSQSRRVEVTSWSEAGGPWQCYLDVDEIIAGRMQTVPEPQPLRTFEAVSKSGTKVVWSKCDRVEFKYEKVFLTKLRKSLGRLFRNHIWDGKKIIVCGEEVPPMDPLFLRLADSDKAVPFGSLLEYIIKVPNTDKDTSTVTVRFVELPLEKWHGWSNEQKRTKGISKGAGVSIVRAGREIDYGWFFMGKKRKENYDDWWRCEVCFDPKLDELFGVSTTKQGIRPKSFLNSILSEDIGQIAHALNRRVRSRFAKVKIGKTHSGGREIAARRDRLMEPPVLTAQMSEDLQMYDLGTSSDALSRESGVIQGLTYRIESKTIKETSFFVPFQSEREIIIVLNENHPFFERIYSPRVPSSMQKTSQAFQHLELTLFAAARAECTVSPNDSQHVIRTLREEWGKVLATFLE